MLTVKAYLPVVNSTVEVRRFNVYSGNYDFNEFQQKLRSIFPSLASKKFNITWTDEENDTITMSSNEELAQAVAHKNHPDCLKVELIIVENQRELIPNQSASTTEKPAEKPAEKPTEKPAEKSTENKNAESDNHPNIICDGCETKVRGSRFKCLECDDYDLCKLCFTKDIHPNHDMLRIVSSNKTIQSAHWFMPMRHIWHKLGRKAAHYQEKQAHYQMKAQCKQAKHELRGFGKHHHFGHHEKFCTRSDDEQNLLGGNQSKTDNPDAHLAAREQSHEMLRCIGETVANLLDPLGINVSIDVENSDGEVEPAVRKRNSKSEEACKNDIEKQATKNDSVDAPTESNTKPKEKEVTFSSAVQEIVIEQPQESTDSINQNQENPDNGWTMISSNIASNGSTEPMKETESSEVFVTAATPLVEAVKICPSAASAKSSTEIRAAAAAAATAAATAATAAAEAMKPFLTTSLYPNLETLSPQVSDALNQMISMGYSNEGGWLSALLKAKNGDIAAVLDVLHPHCPQA